MCFLVPTSPVRTEDSVKLSNVPSITYQKLESLLFRLNTEIPKNKILAVKVSIAMINIMT